MMKEEEKRDEEVKGSEEEEVKGKREESDGKGERGKGSLQSSMLPILLEEQRT